MEALRVWIERAAKSEISGDDGAAESSGSLQHRAAAERGNLGGMVAPIGSDGAVAVPYSQAVELTLRMPMLKLESKLLWRPEAANVINNLILSRW